MESLLDFQFELLTTYFTTGQQPERSKVNNGHSLLSAPYGIYATADGYIALAMMDIHVLGKAIGCEALNKFSKDQAFAVRDEIKKVIAEHLISNQTAYWLTRLQNEGLWAMEVLDWEKMMDQDAYKCLQMEQAITASGKEIITTRCPIRVNGKRIFSDRPAPQLGEHNEKVYSDFIK
jgi:crotonobetainyl-CoA:carnitine CoA-transferase CaiB-like acyl-CoA transferase